MEKSSTHRRRARSFRKNCDRGLLNRGEFQGAISKISHEQLSATGTSRVQLGRAILRRRDAWRGTS